MAKIFKVQIFINGATTTTCSAKINAKIALNPIDMTVTPNVDWSKGIYLFNATLGTDCANIVITDSSGTYIPYGALKTSFANQQPIGSGSSLSTTFQNVDGTMTVILIQFEYDSTWVIITPDEINAYTQWLNTDMGNSHATISAAKQQLINNITACAAQYQLVQSLKTSSGNIQTSITTINAQMTADNGTLIAQTTNYTNILSSVATQQQAVATATATYNSYVQNASDCNTTMVQLTSDIANLQSNDNSATSLASTAQTNMQSALTYFNTQITLLQAEVYSADVNTLGGAANTLTVQKSLSGTLSAINSVFSFC